MYTVTLHFIYRMNIIVLETPNIMVERRGLMDRALDYGARGLRFESHSDQRPKNFLCCKCICAPKIKHIPILCIEYGPYLFFFPLCNKYGRPGPLCLTLRECS